MLRSWPARRIQPLEPGAKERAESLKIDNTCGDAGCVFTHEPTHFVGDCFRDTRGGNDGKRGDCGRMFSASRLSLQDGLGEQWNQAVATAFGCAFQLNRIRKFSPTDYKITLFVLNAGGAVDTPAGLAECVYQHPFELFSPPSVWRNDSRHGVQSSRKQAD